MVRMNNVKLDQIIWLLTGFYILVAHWIWFGRGIQETILIMMMSVAVIIRLKFKSITNLFLTVLLVGLMLFSVFNGAKSNVYLFANIKAIYGGLISYVYIIQLKTVKPQIYNRCFEISRKVLNVYMVINTIIILGQAINHNFFVNMYAVDAVANYGYADHLTGFIGVNGSQRWNLVTCLIIFCNINNIVWQYENGIPLSSKKAKKSIAFIISMILVNIYICMINDTKNFLIVFPLLLFYFYLYRVRKKRYLKYKVYRYLIFIAILVFCAYLIIPNVNQFLNNLISDKIRIYTMGNIIKMVNANDDRVIATYHSVVQSGLWGNGLGSVPMHLGSKGFIKYLGLNSTSVYIYLFGVVGFFIFLAFYASVSASLKKKYNSWIGFTIDFVLLFVISYFLPMLSYISLMFCYGYILCICSEEMKTKSKEAGLTYEEI